MAHSCCTQAPDVHAPWDCANPEQDASDLAITKLVVSTLETDSGKQ